MPENGSFANCCEAGGRAESPRWAGAGGARPSGAPRPPWVAPALSAVLVVTTAVDIVGNLLVILSVLGNRKLRNAGERRARRRVGRSRGPGLWSDPDRAVGRLVCPPLPAPPSLLSTSPQVWS